MTPPKFVTAMPATSFSLSLSYIPLRKRNGRLQQPHGRVKKKCTHAKFLSSSREIIDYIGRPHRRKEEREKERKGKKKFARSLFRRASGARAELGVAQPDRKKKEEEGEREKKP